MTVLARFPAWRHFPNPIGALALDTIPRPPVDGLSTGEDWAAPPSHALAPPFPCSCAGRTNTSFLKMRMPEPGVAILTFGGRHESPALGARENWGIDVSQSAPVPPTV